MTDTARDSGELIFALVAPVGTDYRSVSDHLRSQLFSFRYTTETIQLSSAIELYSEKLGLVVNLNHENEYRRIQSHMREANALYRRFNEICDREEKNALFALHAISEVKERRIARDAKRPLLDTAHVILTLKRPEEVTYLRRVYGQGLHVISVFSPEDERVRFLCSKKHLTAEQSRELVRDDENDNQSGGQRTGAAFHLADLFIDIGESVQPSWESQIDRYLDVLFSDPFKTPSKDEHAMFMAYGASLRSAQLGRQVGAAVANEMGDIIAVGCNEVPSPGGGQYWESSVPDRRDHVLGSDSNDDEKNRLLAEILHLLPESCAKTPALEKDLRDSSLFGITEFGRAVHAEMEALSSCGRRGIPTQNMIVYTTTFPCHNCARHIVGFGIRRVVYIEPYPKSKATLLHDDAITSSAAERSTSARERVSFTPFVGISPRRYVDLFTVTPIYGREVVRKNKLTGNVVEWRRETSELRLQMYPVSYIERESLAVVRLGGQLTQRKLPFGDSDNQETPHGNAEPEPKLSSESN